MFADYCGVKIRHGQLGDQDRNVVREVVQCDGYRLDIRGIMPRANSFVIDIGAHIGSFAKVWHMRNPAAKIVCVEVCPENWEVLDLNTQLIADVERAACTYESSEIVLHNSVIESGGRATGGSIIAATAADMGEGYWRDERPIAQVTLEFLMMKYRFPRIDCLKLDCEGSEFSILEHATCLDRVGFICGEYHGRDRWEELRARKFPDWGYCHLSGGDLGIFHMQNPRWETHFTPTEE